MAFLLANYVLPTSKDMPGSSEVFDEVSSKHFKDSLFLFHFSFQNVSMTCALIVQGYIHRTRQSGGTKALR